MREIKFRVWDQQKNKFKEEISTLIELMEECFRLGRHYDFNKEGAFTTDFCQYTGLKDKNDKEIYEGDILSLYAPYQNIYFPTRVTFQEGCFGIKISSIHIPLKEYTYEKIVIGNIYENPELLENRS